LTLTATARPTFTLSLIGRRRFDAMASVIVQTYEPVAELGGRDGIMLCDEALARDLIEQRRAEILNPQAEAFRYVPGSPAYAAMRENRGQAVGGPVLVLESQGEQTHRGRGRPRKQQPEPAQ
jgi:hypothetical protein